jgi:two-component system chemotaxis sensor kinase CheA
MTEGNFELDAEIFSEFISESLEHLEEIEQKLVEYEENPNDSELMAAIFRGFHSIKGSSGFLQLNNINKLSHQLETLLDELRKGEREVTPGIMDVLFQGCNLLTKMIEDVNRQLSENITPTNDEEDESLNEILRELENIFSGKSEPSTEKKEETEKVSEEAPVEETNEQAQDIPAETPAGYKISPELMNDFRVEAGEHLEACDQVLVKLSETPDNHEAVNDVFRHIHSVKGTASYLGLTGIAGLAHAAESMMEILRSREKVVMSEEDLDLLFEALDVLKDMVANKNVSKDKVESLIERMNKRREVLETGEPEEKEAPTDDSSDPIAIFQNFAKQQIIALKESMEKSRNEEDT